jgi:hypothetical protein
VIKYMQRNPLARSTTIALRARVRPAASTRIPRKHGLGSVRYKGARCRVAARLCSLQCSAVTLWSLLCQRSRSC